MEHLVQEVGQKGISYTGSQKSVREGLLTLSLGMRRKGQEISEKGPSYNSSWLEGPFPSLKMVQLSSPYRKEI